MAVSQGFIDMIREMLAPVGTISTRRMFGGAALYCDGILFAFADDDVLFLKADDTTKSRYEAEGCGPFTYAGQTGPVSMQYWRLPERLYDEPDDMLEFAREAVGIAAKRKLSKRSGAIKKGATAPPPKAAKRSVPARGRKA